MQVTEFAKIDSKIPSCCKLPFQVGELDAETQLHNLPEQCDAKGAQFKRGGFRRKWILWDPKAGDTGLTKNWPEIADLIARFPGKPMKVHIGELPATARLPVHRDGLMRNEKRAPLYDLFNRTLRIHVPLKTTDDALVYSDGKFYRMKTGECWMLHNMKFHSAINNSDTAGRFHLILDIIPTAETFELVEKGNPNLGFEDKPFFDRHWPNELML